MTGRSLAVLFACVAMLVGSLTLMAAPTFFGSGVAHAQPGPRPAQPRPDARAKVGGLQKKQLGRTPAKPEAPSAAPVAAPTTPDQKRRPGNSKPVAIFFWLFALATIGGALFVITRRNLIAAVVGMVGTFLAIAALYAMLYAHFLAVIQVLVYAGAIMVLFVFVIMILNRPVEEPWAQQSFVGKALALVASLYLFIRLAWVLWFEPAKEVATNVAPGETIDGFDFGSTRAVGNTLFHEYLFPFEAVSIVLLIAIVGAIVVARPHAKREAELSDAEAAAGEGE